MCIRDRWYQRRVHGDSGHRQSSKKQKEQKKPTFKMQPDRSDKFMPDSRPFNGNGGSGFRASSFNAPPGLSYPPPPYSQAPPSYPNHMYPPYQNQSYSNYLPPPYVQGGRFAPQDNYWDNYDPNYMGYQPPSPVYYSDYYGYRPQDTDDLSRMFDRMSVADKEREISKEDQELLQALKKKVNPSKYPIDFEKAKFYVIKSYIEDDVHKAIKYGIWCSTKEGNQKLNTAYQEAKDEYPIFLLFSVNASGQFVGIAKMISEVDFQSAFDKWNQFGKWVGMFKIEWIFVKDVPNKEFRHLINELNENKPVPNSRDCQEVPFKQGCEVIQIFERYQSKSSILDDFDYYEKRQAEMTSKLNQLKNRRRQGMKG
eukprot:TRINITY_DN1909_c0_g1_i30.p1 TRINITY_DN1909_c0_g1~~TRINITY_DN1909_c0_g1_i30.p1  ORF type:complete len:384 (+),score=90.67 TRINITY_DN1909_c0_g1_i30:49-1152(+)